MHYLHSKSRFLFRFPRAIWVALVYKFHITLNKHVYRINIYIFLAWLRATMLACICIWFDTWHFPRKYHKRSAPNPQNPSTLFKMSAAYAADSLWSSPRYPIPIQLWRYSYSSVGSQSTILLQQTTADWQCNKSLIRLGARCDLDSIGLYSSIAKKHLNK